MRSLYVIKFKSEDGFTWVHGQAYNTEKEAEDFMYDWTQWRWSLHDYERKNPKVSLLDLKKQWLKLCNQKYITTELDLVPFDFFISEVRI